MNVEVEKIKELSELIHEVEQLRDRRREGLVLIEQLRDEKYSLLKEVVRLKMKLGEHGIED